jgi:hypothetical protein
VYPCDVRLSQKMCSKFSCMYGQATDSYSAHLMSLTFILFRSGRAVGFFRTGDTGPYMVCRLRSHWYFSPITTFHLSANIVTVLVRLLYCMNFLIRRLRCAACAMESGHLSTSSYTRTADMARLWTQSFSSGSISQTTTNRLQVSVDRPRLA